LGYNGIIPKALGQRLGIDNREDHKVNFVDGLNVCAHVHNSSYTDNFLRNITKIGNNLRGNAVYSIVGIISHRK
jgi:hypothetical protein